MATGSDTIKHSSISSNRETSILNQPFSNCVLERQTTHLRNDVDLSLLSRLRSKLCFSYLDDDGSETASRSSAICSQLFCCSSKNTRRITGSQGSKSFYRGAYGCVDAGDEDLCRTQTRHTGPRSSGVHSTADTDKGSSVLLSKSDKLLNESNRIIASVHWVGKSSTIHSVSGRKKYCSRNGESGKDDFSAAVIVKSSSTKFNSLPSREKQKHCQQLLTVDKNLSTSKTGQSLPNSSSNSSNLNKDVTHRSQDSDDIDDSDDEIYESYERTGPEPCTVDAPLPPVYDQVKDGMNAPMWSLSAELEKLSHFGWYWGPITRLEAEEKLSGQPDGAFLVRDSSDDHYLLSLSFRSYSRTLHTRIEHCNGVFSLYTQTESEGYTSIVDLIEHSLSDSQTGVFCYSRARVVGSPSFPVRLTKPVSRFAYVRSLQYLCRFVIRQYTRVDNIQRLPLPIAIKDFIEERQY